jgi:acetolactate synthase-1/3 small subunit
MSSNGYSAAPHIVVAIVEDKPGVLQRVAGLFRRRGFNIESLAVGHSEVEGLSRITLVVDGASAPVEQVVKQLYKLIDVVKVSDLTDEAMVSRELVLLKVRCNSESRHEVLEIANLFRANVVDISTGSLILQTIGDQEKIDALIDLCKPYGIRELTRTGTVSMVRGNKTTTVKETEPDEIAKVHQSQGRRVNDSQKLPFSSD